ncbi:MAG: hypothetical protein B6D61_10055 [Bacteroidetes bacterium 4484_249]|nr:MAG: hypothetical protein B6D61_10055 [Bacteroidetes bacterium 4484_249]
MLYEILTEYNQLQLTFFKESFEKLATKEDIKMVIEMMDKRFEAVDKRFEAVDKRFEAVDKRFETVDKRFEDMYRYMDKRFSSLQWFIGIAFGILSVLITMLKLFG